MIKLSTGKFELNYHKGAVRWMKCNGKEILRMIYPAVRDRNWGTVEPEIISEKVTEESTGFIVEVRIRYLNNDIYFEADYLIRGKASRLEFEMDGLAKSTFLTNRTGLCILHPIVECSGKTCRIVHPDGSSDEIEFPRLISPWQPMQNISGMEWQPAEELAVKLKLSGDVFEMEDQRNWTDASYKTYCRPLDLPFPYEISKGDKVRQKVELEILTGTLTNEWHEPGITFRIDKNRQHPLPEIGVGSTSREEPLTKKEAEILNSFPFGHLRCEIKLFNKEWKLEWARAAHESLRLGTPLFAVLYISASVETELNNFISAVLKTGAQVKYILLVGRNHLPDDNLTDRVYDSLKNHLPQVLVGAGVNAYFAELNRNRPQALKYDFINFTISPQVHAFDNDSLIENLEGQKYAVESARTLFAGIPVFVSPITLKQRFNAVATTEEPAPSPGQLPTQVDYRQPDDFAARWLLGSMKYLSQAGAGLISYFETAGWRGFIQGSYDPPVPEKFPALKWDVFPVFQLLLEFIGFDRVLHSESSSPLITDGLVLRNMKSGEGKLILANFGPTVNQVKIFGIEVTKGYVFRDKVSEIRCEEGYVAVPSQRMVIFPFHL